MRLKNYSGKKFKKELLKIIGAYLPLTDYRIFVFGSRVNGKGDERSDIDIGIEGVAPIPLAVMAKIRADVEGLPTLYDVDMVDFKRVEADFRAVALSKIEMLN